MSSAVNGFVHAIRKHSHKVPYAKVINFGSFGPILMIQPSFNIARVLLD